ncbi:MAG: DUF255 domain-containing protein [Chitinophagales bacterium]|nr:DUF255 domain-containing protein [Chitinophagales bacterium]MDW8392796.1 DUF255 domain-containing protein [Chitinophagales bacterium]
MNSVGKRSLLLLVLTLPLFAAAQSAPSINWISLSEAEQKMQKAPKKVLIDIYTDWCGWCKKLDATTYRDPRVVEYINEKFYAVKFNPEKQQSITFKGKTYGMNGRNNAITPLLMGSSRGYPTTTFLDEKLEVISPVSGYQNAEMMLTILKYIGENHYQTTDWNSYMNGQKKSGSN